MIGNLKQFWMHTQSINFKKKKNVKNVCFENYAKIDFSKDKKLFYLIFVLILIILCFFLQNRSYAQETRSDILIEQQEVIKEMNINKLLRTTSDITIIDLTGLVSGGVIEHDCSNYLTNKYDDTAHWKECTIPGCKKRYDVTNHTYEEYWLKGESCSSSNKVTIQELIHILITSIMNMNIMDL